MWPTSRPKKSLEGRKSPSECCVCYTFVSLHFYDSGLISTSSWFNILERKKGNTLFLEGVCVCVSEQELGASDCEVGWDVVWREIIRLCVYTQSSEPYSGAEGNGRMQHDPLLLAGRIKHSDWAGMCINGRIFLSWSGQQSSTFFQLHFRLQWSPSSSREVAPKKRRKFNIFYWGISGQFLAHSCCHFSSCSRERAYVVLAGFGMSLIGQGAMQEKSRCRERIAARRPYCLCWETSLSYFSLPLFLCWNIPCSSEEDFMDS